MIKFVILSGIFGLTTYIGFAISKTYQQKMAFYQDVLIFCRNLKNDITFLKTDIVTIFEKENYGKDFAKILKIAKQMTKENSTKEQLKIELEKLKNLTEKDIELLSEFFYSLGRLNYQEQIASIDYFANSFEELSKNQTEKSGKMMPFCKKIGILAGLSICIVLI